MADSIEKNLTAVERSIGEACDRAGRDRSEITLVAVSKTFPASYVDEAIRLGVTDIGENRVQEAESKLASVEKKARFHLIGHLQSNKSKLAASLFDVIQTVDSSKLARRLDEAAAEGGRSIEVMIQVNVGEEEQKYGVESEEAYALAAEVNSLEHLELTGLMTIPPIADEPATRRFFAKLRSLREEISERLESETFRHLSMGMSADYGIAIEEGATIIRVGSAIFGSRD